MLHAYPAWHYPDRRSLAHSGAVRRWQRFGLVHACQSRLDNVPDVSPNLVNALTVLARFQEKVPEQAM